MKPEIPDELLELATQWNELHRWERRELGKTLRRLGLTYREIREIVSVPKGTLSNWCRDIDLSADQKRAIADRTPTQKGVPRDSQWRRRLEIERIRRAAYESAATLIGDPKFVAGIVLYWAEGSKCRNDFAIANTDPAALRLFIDWVRKYLDSEAEFRLSLHLHEGNDEIAAKDFWRTSLQLPTAGFTKTYIKPRGTGHRKNHLAYGVCRVRVMRASNHWNRTMAWIDHISEHLV
jgi:hypothetical protein